MTLPRLIPDALEHDPEKWSRFSEKIMLQYQRRGRNIVIGFHRIEAAAMKQIKEAGASESQKAIHRDKIWGRKRPGKEAGLLYG